MKLTKEYSIISTPKDKLCPGLFDDEREFRQDVRIKILNAAKNIISELKLNYRYIWIIGSSLTYQYDDNSDIDVNISTSKIPDDEVKEMNRFLGKKFNGNIILDGAFPVNFHIISKPYSKNFSEGIYDLINNHWVKRPMEMKEEDVENLIKSCLPNPLLEELIKEYLALIDIVENYQGPKNDKKFLATVMNSAEAFLSVYDSLRLKRRELYVKGNKERVTSHCISIVYKMAENFGLGKLYKNIKKLEEEIK